MLGTTPGLGQIAEFGLCLPRYSLSYLAAPSMPQSAVAVKFAHWLYLAIPHGTAAVRYATRQYVALTLLHPTFAVHDYTAPHRALAAPHETSPHLGCARPNDALRHLCSAIHY